MNRYELEHPFIPHAMAVAQVSRECTASTTGGVVIKVSFLILLVEFLSAR